MLEHDFAPEDRVCFSLFGSRDYSMFDFILRSLIFHQPVSIISEGIKSDVSLIDDGCRKIRH
jgi:hypothetical protein